MTQSNTIISPRDAIKSQGRVVCKLQIDNYSQRLFLENAYSPTHTNSSTTLIQLSIGQMNKINTRKRHMHSCLNGGVKTGIHLKPHSCKNMSKRGRLSPSWTKKREEEDIVINTQLGSVKDNGPTKDFLCEYLNTLLLLPSYSHAFGVIYILIGKLGRGVFGTSNAVDELISFGLISS